MILSVPLVGTWLAFLVFGGEFPADHIISRLFIVHVLIVPGGHRRPVGVHLAIVWRQKHTQFPGPGRTEDNVVGSPALADVRAALDRPAVRRRRRARSPSAAWCRSTRSGSTGRTSRTPSPPPPSRTGTWAGSRARCACSPPFRLHLFGYRVPEIVLPAVIFPTLTFVLLYLPGPLRPATCTRRPRSSTTCSCDPATVPTHRVRRRRADVLRRAVHRRRPRHHRPTDPHRPRHRPVRPADRPPVALRRVARHWPGSCAATSPGSPPRRPTHRRSPQRRRRTTMTGATRNRARVAPQRDDDVVTARGRLDHDAGRRDLLAVLSWFARRRRSGTTRRCPCPRPTRRGPEIRVRRR